MSPSLAVMVLTLVTSASPWEALLAARPPTNTERAKRGLLPRKTRPSRVTYLDGAARSRGEVREFPAAAAPPTVLPDDGAERSGPVLVAAAEPQAPSAAPTRASSPATVSAAAPQPKAVAPEPEAVPEPWGVAVAPPAAAPGSRTARAEPPPSSDGEERADRARDTQAAGEALVVERSIDRAGRILERRLGRDLRLLSLRVVGLIDELPVLSSERTENGEVVERVADRAGVLEVRRDPVGRFLSARPLPPPSADEED